MTAAIAEPTYATAPTAAPTAPAVTLVEQVPSVADPQDARNDRLAAAAQRRAAARTRDLTALLRERPDLAGVHAPADFAVDAVRWCA
ncbi:MAG TPA: hypothetical protein VFP51_12730 [Nocardioidaceae bacterium]|nr:hypothetical protein [Nocardioidaceae bacterium]